MIALLIANLVLGCVSGTILLYAVYRIVKFEALWRKCSLVNAEELVSAQRRPRSRGDMFD